MQRFRGIMQNFRIQVVRKYWDQGQRIGKLEKVFDISVSSFEIFCGGSVLI